MGITEAKIDAALSDSPEVRAAVIAKTKEVQQYWRSIAPVSHAQPHPVTKGSGEVIDSPEAYRRSIKYRFKDGADGLEGVVYSDAPHARWLEWGSVHNPVYGFAQRVVDHFGGHDGTVSA